MYILVDRGIMVYPRYGRLVVKNKSTNGDAKLKRVLDFQTVFKSLKYFVLSHLNNYTVCIQVFREVRVNVMRSLSSRAGQTNDLAKDSLARPLCRKLRQPGALTHAHSLAQPLISAVPYARLRDWYHPPLLLFCILFYVFLWLHWFPANLHPLRTIHIFTRNLQAVHSFPTDYE